MQNVLAKKLIKIIYMKFIGIKNKRALSITIVITIIVLGIFWQDRYSALIDKANDAIAGNWKIEEKISLDAGWVENSPQYSLEKRSYNTFLNWSYANRKGMTFGIIFASLILTLMTFMTYTRNTKNKYLLALEGIFLGAPLGVCSNCVAPITKSLLESGFKKITSLGAMLASPTLNIVILFMVFTIFPLHIALIKVLALLILVFILLPLFVKEDSIFVRLPVIEQPNFPESWVKSFLTFFKTFLAKLWYICSRTLPFMAMGGFLGALVSNLIDLKSLVASDSWQLLLGLAIFGTFLPVPMAFDVFLSESMMIVNTPLSSVTVLLTTLGTFSIFSFAIVWQTFGKKTALLLFMAVVILGFLSGLLVKHLNIQDKIPSYSTEIIK